MREIKYRAWSKQGKKMLTWEKYNEETGTGLKDWGIRVVCDENYPVMLFTGLKDKNGNEIYEGDIFKLDGRAKNPYGIIKFGEYSLRDECCGGDMCDGHDNTIGFYVEHNKFIWPLWDDNKRVVLGNIYENKAGVK